MFFNVNTGAASRPRFLGKLSHNEIILSEFKYRRGSEIFGEAEPAGNIVRPVGGEERDGIALLDALRDRPMRDLIGARVQGAIGERSALEPKRDVVSVAVDAVFEIVGGGERSVCVKHFVSAQRTHQAVDQRCVTSHIFDQSHRAPPISCLRESIKSVAAACKMA